MTDEQAKAYKDKRARQIRDLSQALELIKRVFIELEIERASGRTWPWWFKDPLYYLEGHVNDIGKAIRELYKIP